MKASRRHSQGPGFSGGLVPCPRHPTYWQYHGRPVLLLGGSVEDNLFQVEDLQEHLDLLAQCGGNYVRCTLSSRDPGDVWPFEKDARTGLYDLSRPGEQYWLRFERFCELTAQREIFVQIELWDRFDFSRLPWRTNPYNPLLNLNYTCQESGLEEDYPNHPSTCENPFFRSVPALENNKLLLEYQQAHVEALLSIALRHDHLLFCMDNETNESPAWGAYWAGFLHERAQEAGRVLQTTEMWDAHDIRDQMHEATWKHPELYGFCDISQNNHSPADRHWQNLLWFRKQVLDSPRPRPINTVKIYGANAGQYGSGRDGQERFWRNIIGGLAAARFHRPDEGLGLGEIARKHLRSMRMFTDELDIFVCEPACELLSRVSWNEAYCTARVGAAYGVFFCDGGDVDLDISAVGDREVVLRWLDIRESRWVSAQTFICEISPLRLITPRPEGYWAAVVKTV